jgi:FAD/FMN-containing dehydrogenase
MLDIEEAGIGIPGFTGLLMRPGEPEYDAARKLFNGMIDRRPRFIARCASASDVAAAIGFARANALPISVHGGGHSVTGGAMCADGVCIDLRGMKAISVDPSARTARAEGGATWGEFDAATQAHGLAITGGRNPTTGVGGLTLGSGSGWIERKFGYTCDDLIMVEMVTADGRQVIASETANPDLFWALHGGGGNFGVVTAFHFRLHELGPMVTAGMLVYPAAMAGAALRHYREFIRHAPDEVGGGFILGTAPPAEFVPEPARGQPAAMILVTHVGPASQAEADLGALRRFGPPAADLIGPMPYVEVQKLTEPGNPPGMRNYWTADFYGDLPDDAVDTLVDRATHPVSPLSVVVIVPGGGAPSRVDENATPLAGRKAAWNIHYLSMWTDAGDDEANIAFTQGLSGAMKPWTTGRVYLNWIGDEGQERIAQSFGPTNYARLQAIKAQWDPENLFRLNQNIRPAAMVG